MEIAVIFLPDAEDDFVYWQKSGNKIIQQRIAKLIEDIKHSPYQGIGKPELLKHNYAGWWSRRINEKHRLIYRVDGTTLIIAQMRFHYKD